MMLCNVVIRLNSVLLIGGLALSQKIMPANDTVLKSGSFHSLITASPFLSRGGLLCPIDMFSLNKGSCNHSTQT